MRDAWLPLIDRVLRPARPDLARCLDERALHIERRRIATERRQREIAGCEARIHDLRATVFSANDGVVTSRMTALEREWRTLSRRDPEAGMMDLWARIAPASWLDEKRWRDSPPAARVDAAIALASDVDGVEEATRAITSLREALRKRGRAIGERIRFHLGERDFDPTADLLSDVLSAAREALAERGEASAVLGRAADLERDVRDASIARLPTRPVLAASVAHAAFVDVVCRAASRDGADAVTALRGLWRTGYVLGALDDEGVTIEIPPL